MWDRCQRQQPPVPASGELEGVVGSVPGKRAQDQPAGGQEASHARRASAREPEGQNPPGRSGAAVIRQGCDCRRPDDGGCDYPGLLAGHGARGQAERKPQGKTFPAGPDCPGWPDGRWRGSGEEREPQEGPTAHELRPADDVGDRLGVHRVDRVPQTGGECGLRGPPLECQLGDECRDPGVPRDVDGVEQQRCAMTGGPLETER